MPGADIPDYPHTYTVGDELPEFLGILTAAKLITDGFTVRFNFERPDDTGIERDAVLVTDDTFKLAVLATDFTVAGKTKVTVSFIDAGGKTQHAESFNVPVDAAPVVSP